MAGCFVPRHWRLQRGLYGLLMLELAVSVAALALFGIASPNLYRTQLWAEGAALGFNSDPTTVTLARANYRPVATPLVWAAIQTKFNLVASIVTLFLFLAKTTLVLLHVFPPALALAVHAGEVALWAADLALQTAPDTIDPDPARHHGRGAPWYVAHSCSVARSARLRAFCRQAKAAFAVAVVLLAIFCFQVLLAMASLYPTASARAAHADRVARRTTDREKYAAAGNAADDPAALTPEQRQHLWEMQQLPRSPGAGGVPGAGPASPVSPTTPRTHAFAALDGSVAEDARQRPARTERDDVGRAIGGEDAAGGSS